MLPPRLSLQDLSVGYQIEKPILANINEELVAGELVCLLGPNGGGKSTLLKTLAGLQIPLSGKIFIDGQDLELISKSAWAKKCSVVLTGSLELGNMTVKELVTLGRHPFTDWFGNLNAEDEIRIHKSMADVGAEDLSERIFDELSDGEKQRVLLARALAQDPSLLILDEPTAFLDLPRRVETLRILRKLAREQNRSILISTHDLDLALRSADRIWLLPMGGPLISGLPEDLAMQGKIGQVFDQPNIEFDSSTGQFNIHSHPDKHGFLAGDPELIFWTQRALEREGFSIQLTDIESFFRTEEKSQRVFLKLNWRDIDRPEPSYPESNPESNPRLKSDRNSHRNSDRNHYRKPSWEMVEPQAKFFSSLEELIAFLRNQFK